MTELAHASPVFHRVIGIDLGTTTCVVSLSRGAQVTVLPPVPAVVGQNAAGQVTVGEVAGSDAETAIAGIKRELGSGRRIRFRGREYQPQEICAFILIELKRQAEALVGEPVHDAVITVPTTYAEPQRRAITEAAGLAQLNVRRLLEEPVAVAVGAAPGVERPRTCAIYDLGGGTFDASIIAIGGAAYPRVSPGDAARFAVLGCGGDPRLGGDDFDELIVGYALRQIRERHHVDLSRDARIRRRIRREAEIRKRELSARETTTLDLPLLTATVDASVPVTRRIFEAMIEPDLERTFVCLTAALAEAEAAHGVGRAEVDEVLLVGGSTRIPLIRLRLAGYFGLDPALVRADPDPDELVARGAALVAREYPESAMFEGSPLGVRAANLRLRSEMAGPAPGPSAPPPVDAGGFSPPGVLPVPPAETPADFRPAAQRAHDLLAAASPDASPALRAAYTAFVAAIQVAAPDRRLHELGNALRAALAAR